MKLRKRPFTLAAALLAFTGSVSACGGDEDSHDYPEQYTIAVMMPLHEGETLRDIDFIAQKINDAGGIHGHSELVLRYVDTQGLEPEGYASVADELIADPTVLGVVGPGHSREVMALADKFVTAGKPMVSPNDTAGDVLRAFGGANALWRTKVTDLVQAEFIVRRLRSEGVERLGMLTPLEQDAETFFSWLTFYAQDEGYAADDIVVATVKDSHKQEQCDAAVSDLLAAGLDAIVVVPASGSMFQCAGAAFASQRDEDDELPTRVVLADLGVEHHGGLADIGAGARGIEGWSAGHPYDPEAFSAEWEAYNEGRPFPSAAASGHDALLLLAYGIEEMVATGATLPEAMQRVVAGAGEVHGHDVAGIKATLTAIRDGEAPTITGATGPLTYDPEIGVDLTGGALWHWVYTVPAGAPVPPKDEITEKHLLAEYDDVLYIGADGNDPRFDASASESSYEAPAAAGEGLFIPSSEQPGASKALIITASAGWENYRHQADALARYQLLRAAGLEDSDIVMVGADDLAYSPENAAPGEVRNVPEGPDLRAGAVYDYTTGFVADDVAPVLLGESSPRLPEVLSLDADTNLYIYIVGHGGLLGVGFGAETTAQGIAGAGSSLLLPSALTETLCTLREMDSVRRVFVEIESCYAGVYGDAEFDGIEAGCGDGPLSGVLMMTSSGTLENSIGSGWDPTLQTFVSDEFSRAVLDRLELAGDSINLLELYRDVFLSVAGSHAGVYNSATYGELSSLSPAEYELHP